MRSDLDPDDVAIVVRGIEASTWDLCHVKAWADEQIAAATAPPAWLLRCTMCSSVLDARSELLEGAVGSPLLLDDELGLALLAERLASSAITPREAVRAAFHVVIDRGMSGELAECIYQLDDGFDLADASITGTPKAMERQAADFFERDAKESPSGEHLRAFLEGRGRALRSRRAAERGDATDGVRADNENDDLDR